MEACLHCYGTFFGDIIEFNVRIGVYINDDGGDEGCLCILARSSKI